MKLNFNESELHYLDIIITTVTSKMDKKQVETGLFRRCHKIRSKFKPNAKLTFLGQRDRDLIIELITMRQNYLIKMSNFTSEVEIIQKIIEKLEGKKDVPEIDTRE